MLFFNDRSNMHFDKHLTNILMEVITKQLKTDENAYMEFKMSKPKPHICE